MKKIIINEDWEEVEVPDLSNFFVLIFKQGSDKAGYIKCYDTDEAPVFTEYDNLVNQYSNVKFEEPTSINVIKVPATSQVKAMLEETPYSGDETNKDKIETINHLLGRADCECLKEKVLMSLEEAKKKKKKKKKTPRVTYTMGFPYLNDHRFNHACGTCDCGKDAADNTNDAIGGGEAAGGEGIGDAGPSGDAGGDGGAMGEALVNEAMTPLEKMRALENGTRGFNAAAAGDVKLVNYYNICTKNGLQKAATIVGDEIKRRMKAGTWTLGQVVGLNVNATPTTATPAVQQPVAAPQQAAPASTKIDLDTFDFWDAGKFYIDSLGARMLKHYVDTNDLDDFVKTLEDPTNSTPEIKLSYSLAMLLFAICFNSPDAIQVIRDSIKRVFGISAVELKDYLKNVLLSNTAIMSKVRTAVNEVLNENINKEEKSNMKLTEAKRYIKRYYIRPQNVFASNKAEILQRLAEVEADGANCSVYSLKALEDHDDVHLLQPKDIIYYYDEGVLYDKNHVPVLDYDLNVKNEEERPRISADATSDERFKDVYQDRMTDRTFAEALKEDFYVDFDDVNAYGIKLKEGKEAEYTCCICGEDFEGYGNNPSPYRESGKCCDACNKKFVVPARLMQLQNQDEE
jgi:hypothetical protein